MAVANSGLPNVDVLQSYMQAITSHFLVGSHGDIVLKCTGPDLISNPLAPGQQCFAVDLHNQLLLINQNPPGLPVQRICVIYADNYLGLSNVFGIMFDRGFTTQDDQNSAPIFLADPRQGCAVFLGSIASHRQGTECSTEGLFTTIHEVGHIFNLQHDETVPNFLHSSATNQCFPQSYYQFTPTEQNQLAVCSSNSSVMPGGSLFGSGNATNMPARGSRRGKGMVDVHIAVSRNVFWQFEPIQLEIEIGPTAGSLEAQIPQCIDPSMDGFDIMIENEAGERSLYRSPIRSCGLPGSLRITRDAPYRRDLPLFGQSGGYTFRHTGRHRVWAELAWVQGKARSNILEVEVRRETNLSAHDEKYRRIIKDESVGALLFHRRDLPSRHGILRLKRFLDQEATVHGRGELRYALARAIEARHSARKLRGSERKILETLLINALKDGEASRFQVSRREALLAALGRVG